MIPITMSSSAIGMLNMYPRLGAANSWWVDSVGRTCQVVAGRGSGDAE